MATTPGMTLSAIGPGTWDCSQLAKSQILAVTGESDLARIVAPQIGAVVIAMLASETSVYELARVAFHFARKVIV